MAIHLGNNDSALWRRQWVEHEHAADAADGDVATAAEHATPHDAHSPSPAASPAALSRLLAPSPRDPNAQRTRTDREPAGRTSDLPPPRKDALALICRDVRKLPDAPVVGGRGVTTTPPRGRSTISERAFIPRAITAPAQRATVVGAAAAAMGQGPSAIVPEQVQVPMQPPVQQQPARGWFGRITHSLQARTEQTQDLAALRHAAVTLASAPQQPAGPGWLRGSANSRAGCTRSSPDCRRPCRRFRPQRATPPRWTALPAPCSSALPRRLATRRPSLACFAKPSATSSMPFSMVMNMITNAIKSIGEGNANAVRKG
jgi:hypothetical protein